MNKRKKILDFASYIVIIVLILIECFLILKKTFQNDTFYSIRIGEYLLENGIFSLKTDVFSWHEGLNYCNPHWLNDVVIYIAYAIGNFSGVYVLTLLETMVLGIIIFAIANSETKHKWVSAIVTLFAIFSLQSFLTARAQLISYIIFALEVYFINKFINTDKKRYAVVLMMLAWLLANTHAAVFPIYLVLFVPFIVEAIIAKFLKSDKTFLWKFEVEKQNNLRKLLIVFGLVCVVALINPSGLTPYTYIIKSVSGTTMDYINEHQPVDLTYLKYNKAYIIAYVSTLLVLIFPKQKVKLHDAFLLAGLTILTLMGIRQLAIFIVVCSRIWVKYIDEIKEKILSLKIFKGDKFTILRVLSTLIFLFIIFNLTGKYYEKYGSKDYIEEGSYPVEACEWIVKNLDLENLRIYNNYADGSYMLYAGVPTFIDTRCDLFTAEFNSSLEKGNDIFADTMKVQKEPEKYKEVFEKYDINAALVCKSWYYIEELETDDDFVNVYEDDYYIVYVKKEVLNDIKIN